MNLYIHDIRDNDIRLGDTLSYPKFIKKRQENTPLDSKSSLQKFDIVIANPPWNQDGYDEDVLKKSDFWKERFKFGFPPRKSADWAWIQHMLASTKKNGRVGLIIDNGCLFRGKKEGAIRKQIIEKDLIESVILLPEKLFYNTSAPGAILILNKNKPDILKNKIYFINASNQFDPHPNVKKLNYLSDNHIKKIISTYKSWQENPGFSKIIELEDIRDNDYNLNVTLYVFPEIEIEDIDIQKEWNDIKTIEKEIQQINQKIQNYLNDLK